MALANIVLLVPVFFKSVHHSMAIIIIIHTRWPIQQHTTRWIYTNLLVQVKMCEWKFNTSHYDWDEMVEIAIGTATGRTPDSLDELQLPRCVAYISP